MLLKEALKQNGFTELTDEQYNSIVKAIKESPEEYTPKAVFNEELDKVKKLKSQLDDRDKQLKDLATKAEGNETLQKQIEKLQEDNKVAKKEYEDGLSKMRKEIAIESKYAGQVYDMNDIKNCIDFNKIKLNDKGEIIDGFDEQDKSLRETKPHYFMPASNNSSTINGVVPGVGNSGENKQVGGNSKEQIINASLNLVKELRGIKD